MEEVNNWNFQENDKNQSGIIDLDHIVEIFRMYEEMSKEYILVKQESSKSINIFRKFEINMERRKLSQMKTFHVIPMRSAVLARV